MVSAFKHGAAIFERVYSQHPGTEPEAFKAALEAVKPIIPAVREEIGRPFDKA